MKYLIYVYVIVLISGCCYKKRLQKDYSLSQTGFGKIINMPKDSSSQVGLIKVYESKNDSSGNFEPTINHFIF